jgi:HSP20 family protein
MTIQKFDPVQEFATLRDSISRTLGQSVQAVTGSLYPLVDMYHTESEVVIHTAPIDGKLESVDVTVEGDLLTIRGETKPEDNYPTESYLLRERRFGKFSRALRIPLSVKAEQAQARYKNGILTVTLPRAEATDSETIDSETVE